MKIYVYRIFNLVNKLYLYNIYLDQSDAIYALIKLNRKGEEGIYEIHKTYYCDIIDLTEEN